MYIREFLTNLMQRTRAVFRPILKYSYKLYSNNVATTVSAYYIGSLSLSIISFATIVALAIKQEIDLKNPQILRERSANGVQRSMPGLYFSLSEKQKSILSSLFTCAPEDAYKKLVAVHKQHLNNRLALKIKYIGSFAGYARKILCSGVVYIILAATILSLGISVASLALCSAALFLEIYLLILDYREIARKRLLFVSDALTLLALKHLSEAQYNVMGVRDYADTQGLGLSRHSNFNIFKALKLLSDSQKLEILISIRDDQSNKSFKLKCAIVSNIIYTTIFASRILPEALITFSDSINITVKIALFSVYIALFIALLVVYCVQTKCLSNKARSNNNNFFTLLALPSIKDVGKRDPHLFSAMESWSFSYIKQTAQHSMLHGLQDLYLSASSKNKIAYLARCVQLTDKAAEEKHDIKYKVVASSLTSAIRVVYGVINCFSRNAGIHTLLLSIASFVISVLIMMLQLYLYRKHDLCESSYIIKEAAYTLLEGREGADSIQLMRYENFMWVSDFININRLGSCRSSFDYYNACDMTTKMELCKHANKSSSIKADCFKRELELASSSVAFINLFAIHLMQPIGLSSTAAIIVHAISLALIALYVSLSLIQIRINLNSDLDEISDTITTCIAQNISSNISLCGITNMKYTPELTALQV